LTKTYDAAKNVLTLLQEAIRAADLYGWDIFNPLLMPSSELKCWSYENNPLTWLDETAAANENTADDMNLPLKNGTSPQNDAYYWGNIDAKFNGITIIITRAGVGNWTTSNMIFEYSTATGWASCNAYTTDTSNRFKNAGIQTITFDLSSFASNWAKRAVGPAGNQITAYWIRVRFTATSATVTTAPKAGQCWLSISHYHWFIGTATPRSAFQPLDWKDMQVTISVTSFTSSGTIDINGTDRFGNSQSESFNVTALGDYTTTKSYAALDSVDGIKVTGRFNYNINFPRQGLIGKGSANQYYFLCQFVLGDGTVENASAWVDGDEYPTPGTILYHFTPDSKGSNLSQIWVKGYSSLQFGACPDEAYKVTEGGVTLVNDAAYPIYGDINSDVRLYNTHFYSSVVSTLQLKGTVQRVWNCVLRETYLLVTNGDVYRLSCYSGYPLYQQVSGTFQDIAAIGCFTLALFQTTGTMNIQNFYVRDLMRQNPNQTICVLQAGNRTINLDDGDSDAWNMEASPAQTSTINRRYSFDVAVKDGKTKTPVQNATVILYDKDGNQLFSLTTDANGQVTTQKVVHSDWRYVNSQGLKTSPDNTYSPFKLVVKANGYQIYSNPNITLDKPTRVEVGLVKAVDIIFVDGKPALNLNESDAENELYAVM